VAFKGGSRENRIYVIIAIFVFIVIIITVFFGSNQLIPAYIEKEDLKGDWSEDISAKSGGSQLLGLEKWSTFTYKINDSHPAYIKIITYKLLFMWSEEQLLNKLIELIETSISEGIEINLDSKVLGERIISKGHLTQYVTYNGNDTSKDPIEKIKIIGEAWNCPKSGTSILCIGVAQITDTKNNDSTEYLNHWSEIVKDKEGTFGFQDSEGGLIFNIKCHNN
jgi:hypothetical protein